MLIATRDVNIGSNTVLHHVTLVFHFTYSAAIFQSTMDMSMSMSNSSDMGGMKMYFHFGVHEDILFYTCDSAGG